MKKQYTKPMILTNEELAEGIYAASGDAVAGTAGVTYDLGALNAWDGTKVYNNISITNTSEQKVDSLTITLTIHGTVTSVISNGSLDVTVSGNKIIASTNNWGRGFEANQTVGNFYLYIQGTGDFSIS
jgi:hypothetical protein